MDYGLGFILVLLPWVVLAASFLAWLYTKPGKRWLENL